MTFKFKNIAILLMILNLFHLKDITLREKMYCDIHSTLIINKANFRIQ